MNDRRLAEGQWLGTENRIVSLTFGKHGWVARDSTGESYCQHQPRKGSTMVWCPNGLKSFDEPTDGRTVVPRTTWPPRPANA